VSIYEIHAQNAAKRYGIDPNLYKRLIAAESGWNPRARSPVGATGLAQLMPGTARGLGVNINSPVSNLVGGAKYLSQQLQTFGGDIRKALAAYNAGPGAVQKYGGIPPYRETQNYVSKIMSGYTPGAAPAAPSRPSPVMQKPSNAVQTHDIARARQEAGAQVITQGLSAGKDIFELIPQMIQARNSVVIPSTAVITPSGRQTNLKVQNATGGPVSGNISGIVKEAVKFLGTPYSWGGGGPSGPSEGFGKGKGTVGFDCSSFLQYLHAKRGVKIPRVTYDQWRAGKPVNPNQLQPGDAVFFRPGPRGPEHVGMYIGNGQFIESPRTGDVVKISTLAGKKGYMGARRY
jgi:cell wall-associated NlpC family hydrolase